MQIKNTELTEALRAWLLWAADDGHTLHAQQVGRDIIVHNPHAPRTSGDGLTPTEIHEIESLLVAHATEPFITCPKEQTRQDGILH